MRTGIKPTGSATEAVVTTGVLGSIETVCAIAVRGVTKIVGISNCTLGRGCEIEGDNFTGAGWAP